jgi:Flp pilus assembly protein TadD
MVSAAPAAKASSADWMPLIQSKDFAKARTLCEGWLKATDNSTKAEGHKCLANVELFSAGEHKIRLQGNGQGGGSIGPGYDSEPAQRAVEHLNIAVTLAPQDLSIHQGRLHVLELATMYGRMSAALEQSIKLYKGPDPLDAWVAYPAELIDAGQPKVAEALLLLLDRHYPGDHRVAGNLAALYGLTERDEEALTWAKKAVAAAPNDPVDNWNLARIYDYTGKVDLADAAYKKALPLQTASYRKQASCTYAEFLEQRKKDRTRACEMQRQGGCPTSACGP